MTPFLKTLSAAALAASLILSAPAHAVTAAPAPTPAELNLPADRIQRSLSCIGILWESIGYAEDGTPMGYPREDMEDSAGVWAMWVASMTGLTTAQIYERAEVGKAREAFAANRTNAPAQLNFCMTQLPM